MQEELPFRYEDVEQNKLITVLMTVVPILFFLPLLFNKESRYFVFFGNQCLLVSIALVVCAVIPILGWLCSVIVFVMWIVNIVHAVDGAPKGVPIIGKNVIMKYDNLA